MAVKTKKAAAKVASMRPDEMVAGGLMDDFNGTITKARLVPWDYNGNLDHHILALALTIQPEEGDEFVQHYSTGAELDEFVPSMDGEEPVDLENGEGEELEGIAVHVRALRDRVEQVCRERIAAMGEAVPEH